MISLVQSEVCSCTGMGGLAFVVESLMFRSEGIVEIPAHFHHSLSTCLKSDFVVSYVSILH